MVGSKGSPTARPEVYRSDRLSTRLGNLADDAMGGRLVWDKPVLIQCFTNETALRENTPALREFLVELGSKTNQGAVACVLDKTMYQIKFPPQGD